VPVTDQNTGSLELRKLELQDRERERESQLKLKELEIHEKELYIQLRLKEIETPATSPPSTNPSKFDISKRIRFVPPFQVKPTSDSRLVPLAVREQFNPFVSKGSVSLSDEGEQVPITILRDTGATQSLIVEGTLPLSEETATGATMSIQGVGCAPVSVPLHTVYLHCGLVTGPVVVGTRPSLPVQGISLLLGSDLAGSRVTPDLSVISDPELTTDVDKSMSTIPGLFPACAVTRAAARQTALQM